mgnify:CR=1 FL=1
MKFFVLSRFNIKVANKDLQINLPVARADVSLNNNWISERLVYYKDCLKSLANQTDQDFTIALLVHPDTEQKILDILDGMFKEHNLNYEFIFVGADMHQSSFAKKLEEFLKPHGRVITSRLDTDDQYPIYYVELVKKTFKGEPTNRPIVVDFKQLIYTDNKKTLLFKYPGSSMFLSICSSNPSINSLSQPHNLIKKRVKGLKMIQIKDKIGGKILVHGKNQLNRMRGNKTYMSFKGIFK